MATFWKKIKNKHEIKTYQDTKDSYDWIMKALQKGDFDSTSMEAKFLFTVSGILCSCKGIEEFTENAYGYSDYKLNNFCISFWPGESGLVSITAKSGNEVSISTESRVLLEEIVKLLESTYLDDEAANTTLVVKMEKESTIRDFLTGIAQNIASNLIWYILTLAAGFVIAYLTKK